MHGPLLLHERIDHIGYVLALAAGARHEQVRRLFDWPRLMSAPAAKTPADGFAALLELAKRNGEKANA